MTSRTSAASKSYRRALRNYRESVRQIVPISAELTRKRQAFLRKGYKREKIGMRAPGYVSSDEFFATAEWKELRYKALKRSGGVCACCGARRGAGIVLHVDHIKPRYKFPELSLALSNLQILCADCNRGKGAWDQTDFTTP